MSYMLSPSHSSSPLHDNLVDKQNSTMSQLGSVPVRPPLGPKAASKQNQNLVMIDQENATPNQRNMFSMDILPPKSPGQKKKQPLKRRRASLGIMKLNNYNNTRQERGPSSAKKKAKKSMRNKRVSFGVIDIRQFDKNNQDKTVDLATMNLDISAKPPKASKATPKKKGLSVSISSSPNVRNMSSPSPRSKPIDLKALAQIGSPAAKPINILNDSNSEVGMELTTNYSSIDQFDNMSNLNTLGLEEVEREDTMDFTQNHSVIQGAWDFLQKELDTDNKSNLDAVPEEQEQEVQQQENVVVAPSPAQAQQNSARTSLGGFDEDIMRFTGSLNDENSEPGEQTMEFTRNVSVIQQAKELVQESRRMSLPAEDTTNTLNQTNMSTIDMSMTADLAMDALNFITTQEEEEAQAENADEGEGMEMTRNHSVIQQTVTETQEQEAAVAPLEESMDMSMEMTKNHSEIQQQIIQEQQELEQKEDEVSGGNDDSYTRAMADLEQELTVDMEFTRNFSTIKQSSGAADDLDGSMNLSENSMDASLNMSAMELTRNVSVIKQNEAAPVPEMNATSATMELTKNHSNVLNNQSLNPEVTGDVTADLMMELTRNHSVIRPSALQVEGEEQTAEITTSKTLQARLAAASLGTPVSAPQTPMTFLRGNSSLLKSSAKKNNLTDTQGPSTQAFAQGLNTPSNQLNSIDFQKLARSMQSPNPLNLSQDTIQLTNEVNRILNGMTPKAGEITTNMQKNFGKILAGDLSEKTTELPTRAKMSRLTMDMADLFKNILENGDEDETLNESEANTTNNTSMNRSAVSTPKSVSTSMSMDVTAPSDVSNHSFSSNSSTFFNMSPIGEKSLTNAQAAAALSSSPLQAAFQEVTQQVQLKKNRRRSSIGQFLTQKSVSVEEDEETEDVDMNDSLMNDSLPSTGDSNESNVSMSSETMDLMAATDAATDSLESKQKLQKSSFRFKDFLQVTGTKARLESSKSARRDSEIGLHGMAKGVDWPPQEDDLEGILQMATIEKVENEDYSHMCLLLVDTNAEVRAMNRQMEEMVDYNPPPIFAKLQNLAPDELADVQKEVFELVKRCSYEAYCTWNQYRLQFANATNATLEQNLALLENDANLLKEAELTVQKLVAQEANREDAKLLAMKDDVKQLAQEITIMENKMKNHLNSIEASQEELNILNDKVEQVSDKMEQVAMQNQSSTAIENKMRQTQDDFALLVNVTGCKPLNFTSQRASFLFYDKFTLDLNFEDSNHEDSTDLIKSFSLKTRNATPLRSRNGMFHRQSMLNTFEQRQVKALQPMLAKVIAGVQEKTEMSKVITWLKLRLGRVGDLMEEVSDLAGRFNLMLTPAEDSIETQSIISISHHDRSQNLHHQIVLRMDLLTGYPYAPLMNFSDPNAIVVLSTAPSKCMTREQVQQVVENTPLGPERITEICEFIHENLKC